MVVTDGFHFTRPVELDYRQPSYYHFKVVCAIDDFQLFGCGVILILFYLLGFLTGVFILKLLSFAPVIYLLFVYYIDRKNFIHITQDHSAASRKSRNI
jgi:hypothetical protein